MAIKHSELQKALKGFDFGEMQKTCITSSRVADAMKKKIAAEEKQEQSAKNAIKKLNKLD